jgi:hypothetical protein
MFCNKCGKENREENKFCYFCGKKQTIFSDIKEDQDGDISSVCQICGVQAPTKYNEFYANIGMLFARQQKEIKAEMCRNCTDKYFWKFTLTNLFLGWWGIISFFATCGYMVNNIFRYIFTLNLKKR